VLLMGREVLRGLQFPPQFSLYTVWKMGNKIPEV
jgi:hypothetical protein